MWLAGGQVGAHDGERGGNISAAIGMGERERAVFEGSEFWPLIERFEGTNNTRPQHVSLKADVVTRRKDCSVAFALRHFAAAQYPKLLIRNR